MKWSEFKDLVDAECVSQGVPDPDIYYIDTGNFPRPNDISVVVQTPDNIVSIS